MIDFDKMLKKDHFLDKLQGPHEARFLEPPELPSNMQKNKLVPQFQKQSKRDSIMAKDPKIIAYVEDKKDKQYFGFSAFNQNKGSQIQKVLIPGVPKYDPKFQITTPNLSLSVPNFQKMKMRDNSFLGKPKPGPDNYDANQLSKGFKMQSTFKKE